MTIIDHLTAIRDSRIALLRLEEGNLAIVRELQNENAAARTEADDAFVATENARIAYNEAEIALLREAVK
jgi:hypothetical protein